MAPEEEEDSCLSALHSSSLFSSLSGLHSLIVLHNLSLLRSLAGLNNLPVLHSLQVLKILPGLQSLPVVHRVWLLFQSICNLTIVHNSTTIVSAVLMLPKSLIFATRRRYSG